MEHRKDVRDDGSPKADNTNADVIPCKVSHVDDLTNLNIDESTMPNDPIVQSVDINTKSTSYAGAAGASAKDQPKDHCPKKVVSPSIVSTTNVVTFPTVEKINDGFQTVGKKKKRKGKSKSTNVGQFAGPSIKPNVRYEPKAITSAPKKGATNEGNAFKSPTMSKDYSSVVSQRNAFKGGSAREGDDSGMATDQEVDHGAAIKPSSSLTWLELGSKITS
ncbi:hypothetical protein Tco_0428343 [Tanacetum coccineum]